jgi:hypothetical protein
LLKRIPNPILRGVGTSADHETYYLAESSDYSVPRPFDGNFPVDGYHQP